MEHVSGMSADYLPVLIVSIAIVISLIGVVGCLLPVLPGPLLCYAALLLVRFTTDIPVAWQLLALFGGITAIVLVLDTVLPLYMPRKFGSSGWGIAGATVGLIIGLFFPPIGFIIGPFIGALAFEYYKCRNAADAIVAGIASFFGFMIGTVIKIALCLAITGWLIVRALIPAITG